MALKEFMDTIETSTGAVINFHLLDPRLRDIADLEVLPRHEHHNGDYCQFRKLNGQQPLCGANKARSTAIAQHGRSFWGTCPFGVWDLAQPIRFQERLVAVLYIGSFLGASSLAPADGVRYDGPPLARVSDEKRAELARYARFLADYVVLTCQRWVDSGRKWAVKRPRSYYAEACTAFIHARYTEPIRLQDLADTLGMTANHLGERIKRHFGRSFRQSLERYRIDQAKVSLRSELNKSITQIAFECGFSDSNYFSTVFKRTVGTTPRAYRKGSESSLKK